MPPQSNRRAQGPEQKLGPVQRQSQMANLTYTPAKVDGPDLNNAQIFSQLGKALNLGVEGAGKISAAYKEEKRAGLRAELAKFQTEYDQGARQVADFDGYLVMAGEDPVMQRDVYKAMGRMNYSTEVRRPGVSMGTRAFTFEKQDLTDILENLPGNSKTPLDERLVEFFESQASSIPGYDNLDDANKQAMIGVGISQFKGAIKEDRAMRDAAAKEAAYRGLVRENDAAWFPQLPQSPDAPSIYDTDAIAASATELDGTATTEALSESFNRGAQLFNTVDQFEQLASSFTRQSNFTQAEIITEMNKAMETYAQRVTADLAAELEISLDNTPSTEIPTILDKIEANMDLGAEPTSENVAGLLVDGVIKDKGLPNTKAVRDAVERTLSEFIKPAEESLRAEENHAKNEAAMDSGQELTAGAQQELWNSGGSDLDQTIAGQFGKGAESVISMFGALNGGIKEWKDYTSGQSNQPAIVPAALQGHIMRAGNSDNPGDRLLGMLLYSNLGGEANPNLDFVPAEMQVNFTTMAVMLGKYDKVSGSFGGFREVDGKMVDANNQPINDSILKRYAFVGDTAPVLSKKEIDEFDAAWRTVSDYNFGTGVVFREDADELLLSGVPADFVMGAYQLALSSDASTPKERAAAFLATLMSAKFLPVNKTAGAPALLVWDPKNRLSPEWRADLSGTASDYATGSLESVFEGVINDGNNSPVMPLGFRDAVRQGKIQISLDTSNGRSLSPDSDYAFFNIITTNKDGTEFVYDSVSIRWSTINTSETRSAIDERELRARQAAERAANISEGLASNSRGSEPQRRDSEDDYLSEFGGVGPTSD